MRTFGVSAARARVRARDVRAAGARGEAAARVRVRGLGGGGSADHPARGRAVPRGRGLARRAGPAAASRPAARLRVPAALVAVLLASCSSATDQAGDDLRVQLRRWEALALDSYSFEFRRVCFCGGPIEPLRVVVRADAVVSVTDAGTGATPPYLTPTWTGTIDQIFAELIQDAERAAGMDLSFDPTHHFPSHA